MAPERYPNLFLVGAPKCGTTTLFHYLSRHPDILAGYNKEPAAFLGTPDRPEPTAMSFTEYRQMYLGWTDQGYAIDASTAYLAEPRAAANIRDSVPGARIIVTVRNPILAVYSLYFEIFSQGLEASKSFEEAIARNSRTHDFVHRTWAGYLGTYHFSEHIARYEAAFGPENVRSCLLDDLRAAPALTVAGILRWLDLEPLPPLETQAVIKNPATESLSPAISRLLAKPPAWSERVARVFTSKQQRYRLRKFLRRAVQIERKYPPMKPETHRHLANYYKAEIERLSERFGRDLSYWFEEGR